MSDPAGRELKEALERETATAEILQIIASSPADTQPVFDAIVRAGLRLFADAAISIALPDGDKIRAAAVAEGDPARAQAWRNRFPFPLSHDYMHGIAILDATLVDFPDVANTPPGVAVGAQNFLASGYRAITIMPMLRGDAAIGALSVLRHTPGPLSAAQLAVLKTFAAQAVIAIENTRLLTELRQRTGELVVSLEQQTATSEILASISGSMTDSKPVFEAIVRNLLRLFGTGLAMVQVLKDGMLHLEAASSSAEFEILKQAFPQPWDENSGAGRCMIAKQVIQFAPVSDDPAAPPLSRRMARALGFETVVFAPMMRGELVFGAIATARPGSTPFTHKEIELVTNFAAQAVIAIENTRLLTELRQRTDDLTESLEQQTATSEVLKVISSSPGELEPVFQAMLENATRICEASFGVMLLCEGDGLRSAAVYGGLPSAFIEQWRGTLFPRESGILAFRSIETRLPVNVADLRATPAYLSGNALAVSGADVGGIRTMVTVPMLKDDETVGVIAVYRQEVRPFTDKQIALLTNFAAQAVIAIENTRLLNEVRQQASQLEAQSQELRTLNQGLEERVSDQVGEIERMSRLRRFLPPQVADLIVSSGAEKQLESHRREITALFCDLRGFTGFSESSDPEDVMALLREYHAAIGKIIFQHGGTLERFAGDGVMVIFNDPVPLPNPALAAVMMALDLRAAITALIEKWRRLGHDLGFGIGISHGYATLGTIGFEGRFDYAAIGTVSNVASRLCDEAKPGQILISPRVLMAVETAVSVEPAGEMTLKGIRRPVPVHNVVDMLAAAGAATA